MQVGKVAVFKPWHLSTLMTKFVLYCSDSRDAALEALALDGLIRLTSATCSSFDDINVFACKET